MDELRALLSEHLADQEPAMAVVWLSTAAHDRETALLGTLEDPLDTPEEGRGLGHRAVKRVALGVQVVFVGWTPTQLLTHEDVANPYPSKGALYLLPVEVICKPRVGMRANVDQVLDPMLRQKAQEVLLIVVRVTNGPDLDWGVHVLSLIRAADGHVSDRPSLASPRSRRRDLGSRTSGP